MNPAELAQKARDHQLPPLVFLYGPETYLIHRALEGIRDATVPPEARDFNLQSYDGKDVDPIRLIEEARTFPVFAPRRMILVREADKLSSASMEALLPYLKNPVDETLLLFVGEKIDGRRKFFQVLRKTGLLVEFKSLYDNQIPAFVRREAQQLNLSFTEEGMANFCRRVGTNLQEIVGQLHKLQNYLGGEGLVDREEVVQLVTDSRQDSIFDLTDAMGAGKIEAALVLLRRMLEEGEPPLRILTMIVRHYRQMWKTADAMAQRLPKKEIARKVGINPYFLDGLIRQARQRTINYPAVMRVCLDTDQALKSSGAHPEAQMEMLLFRLGAETKGKGGS